MGKPIRVDYATNHLTRARYARVCVEIDLTKPILSKVWVGNHWQTILYENLHSLCFHCGRVGHQKSQCADLKGKSPVQQQNPTESFRVDGPLVNHLGHGHVSDPGVSNPTDMQVTDGGLHQKKQNGIPTGPLDSEKTMVLSGEFGLWTTVTHRKPPNSISSQARSQRVNKNKHPKQNTLPSSPENRKKQNNSSYSNGNSPNKV